MLPVQANGETFVSATKGPGKRGHIVADTLLLMMFLGLRKLGNICCGHKMFLNKIRNIFCVPQQMLPVQANGKTFVSATKGPGKRGHFVADTLLLVMFLGRANAWDTK